MGFLRWLVRGFSSKRLAAANRLAVVDAAAVDGRRRLVLIRRDNVEHLLMIGGGADIVVEPNTRRRSLRPHQPSSHRCVRNDNRPWLGSRHLSTPRPSHRYHWRPDNLVQ